MMFPNYDESILSVTSAVCAHFGAETRYPPLKEVTEALNAHKTRSVVVLLLDGLGANLIKRFLPEGSFLRRHCVRDISTVYPSTTTAATTSMWTCLSPLEHGWLGWSCYFKECARQIDLFLNRDSHTHDIYAPVKPADTFMPLQTIYPKLKGRCETHAVFPFPTSAAAGVDFMHTVSGFADSARIIKSLCREPGEKLICCYINEPDHTMHNVGVNVPETAALFKSLDRQVEALSAALPNDALLITIADHGLVDVSENVDLKDFPEIYDCLWMPPSIEPRAATLFVKPHMTEQFEREFNREFGRDFMLLTREQALEKHLFGKGIPHKKVDDFLGNYVACATGSRSIGVSSPTGEMLNLKGQHAGLTEDEMLVPVIICRSKD